MGRILKHATIAALFSLIATPALAGTATAGAQTFRAQCAICHAATLKAPPGVGPRLFGVVGRKAGSLPGFTYSPAMQHSGLTWDAANLRQYIANPGQFVKANRMPYQGLHNPAQMDDLIAYLESLK